MIKVFQEREMGEPIRIGRKPVLENIRAALMELGAREGLPIDVQVDEVKIGKGLSSIGAPQYSCVVVYNRDHRKDYYCHVFAVEEHYNDWYLQGYLGGDSASYRTIVLLEKKQSRNFLDNQLLIKAKKVHKDERIYQERLMSLLVPAFRMASEMPDRQAEAEARRRQAEAEAQRRQAEAEAQRRQAEAEAQRRQAEAETKRRQAEAEAQRRQAEAEARRRQVEAETKRRQAEAETKRRQAEAETKRRQAEAEAQHRRAQAEAQRRRQETVRNASTGWQEAARGPAQAEREYCGGTRETCSTYRYHNGTMTWTAAPAETAYRNFACRKCGKQFRARKGSGCHRITCGSCGHVIEVTC